MGSGVTNGWGVEVGEVEEGGQKIQALPCKMAKC